MAAFCNFVSELSPFDCFSFVNFVCTFLVIIISCFSSFKTLLAMLLLLMSHLWDARLKKLHDLFCYKFGSHT